MKIKKVLLIVLGWIGLIIGCIGVVVPLLPAFPFLLLAMICFSKSSEKLDRWFKSTKVYHNNLESYVQGKGMTKKTKIKVLIIITLLMSFGFYMMDGVIVGRIVLFFVWIFHLWYFIYRVKNFDEYIKKDI